MISTNEFSRIGKFFVDRDGLSLDDALEKLTQPKVALCCGPEVAASATLQAAVLTSAAIAARCFPGRVTVNFCNDAAETPLRVPFGRQTTLEGALNSLNVIQCPPDSDSRLIVVGGRDDIVHGLQVTFDGWLALVEPKEEASRLPEREYNVLAGVAAGALAVSETFLNFAGITYLAGRRRCYLSLWQPGADYTSPDAVGIPIHFLPDEIWCMGLGHLGQAYVWCLGLLPYPNPADAKIVLNDFDHVVNVNADTGLLTNRSDVGALKTRVALRWLEERGYNPIVIEHPFQEGMRRLPWQPAWALCGFDGSGPRHSLDQLGFELVSEAGLGGRSDNFDAILCHSFPGNSQLASEIWPTGNGSTSMAEAVVLRNPFYKSIAQEFGCGHMQLANTAVAVPFVGAIAASLVVSDGLRIMHGGKHYESIDLRLECPNQAQAMPSKSEARINIRHQTTIEHSEVQVSSL